MCSFSLSFFVSSLSPFFPFPAFLYDISLLLSLCFSRFLSNFPDLTRTWTTSSLKHNFLTCNNHHLECFALSKHTLLWIFPVFEVVLKLITFSQLPFSKYPDDVAQFLCHDHCEGTLHITAHRRSIPPRCKRGENRVLPQGAHRTEGIVADLSHHASTRSPYYSPNVRSTRQRNFPPHSHATRIFRVIPKRQSASLSVLVLLKLRISLSSRVSRAIPRLHCRIDSTQLASAFTR